MDKKILDIRSLKKYYGKGENLTRAVDGISFYVLPGEFVGIMGPSGSGQDNTSELYRLDRTSHRG